MDDPLPTEKIELLEKMSFFAILVAWETTDLTKRIIKKLSTTLSNAMRKWIYESFFNYVDQILPIIDPLPIYPLLTLVR